MAAERDETTLLILKAQHARQIEALRHDIWLAERCYTYAVRLSLPQAQALLDQLENPL